MSMWGQERCDHVGLCSAIFNPDYPDLRKIRSGFVFDSCSVGQCRGHVGPTWDLCICWAYVGPLGAMLGHVARNVGAICHIGPRTACSFGACIKVPYEHAVFGSCRGLGAVLGLHCQIWDLC